MQQVRLQSLPDKACLCHLQALPTMVINGAYIWNCPPQSQLYLDKDVILRDHFNPDKSGDE